MSSSRLATPYSLHNVMPVAQSIAAQPLVVAPSFSHAYRVANQTLPPLVYQTSYQRQFTNAQPSYRQLMQKAQVQEQQQQQRELQQLNSDQPHDQPTLSHPQSPTVDSMNLLDNEHAQQRQQLNSNDLELESESEFVINPGRREQVEEKIHDNFLLKRQGLHDSSYYESADEQHGPREITAHDDDSLDHSKSTQRVQTAQSNNDTQLSNHTSNEHSIPEQPVDHLSQTEVWRRMREQQQQQQRVNSGRKQVLSPWGDQANATSASFAHPESDDSVSWSRTRQLQSAQRHAAYSSNVLSDHRFSPSSTLDTSVEQKAPSIDLEQRPSPVSTSSALSSSATSVPNSSASLSPSRQSNAEQPPRNLYSMLNGGLRQPAGQPLHARDMEWRPSRRVVREVEPTDPITFRYSQMALSNPFFQNASFDDSSHRLDRSTHRDSLEQASLYDYETESRRHSSSFVPDDDVDAPSASSMQIQPAVFTSKLKLLKQRMDPAAVTAVAGMPSHRAERRHAVPRAQVTRNPLNLAASSPVNSASSSSSSSSAMNAALNSAAAPSLQDPPARGRARVPSYENFVRQKATEEIKHSRRASAQHPHVDHLGIMIKEGAEEEKQRESDERQREQERSLTMQSDNDVHPFSSSSTQSVWQNSYGYNNVTPGFLEREKDRERSKYEAEFERLRAAQLQANQQLRIVRMNRDREASRLR